LRRILRIFEGLLRFPEEPLRILEELLRILEKSLRMLEEPLRILEKPVRILEKPLRILEEPLRILKSRHPALDAGSSTHAQYQDHGEMSQNRGTCDSPPSRRRSSRQGEVVGEYMTRGLTTLRENLPPRPLGTPPSRRRGVK